MFSHLASTLLLAILSPSAFILCTPLDAAAAAPAAVLDARMATAYNFTTYPHNDCTGDKARTYNGATTDKTCHDVSGHSIKLWSVADGCEVTANTKRGCWGLFDHRHHVKQGCNDLDFRSIRIKC
jgi:hypothetical protein